MGVAAGMAAVPIIFVGTVCRTYKFCQKLKKKGILFGS